MCWCRAVPSRAARFQARVACSSPVQAVAGRVPGLLAALQRAPRVKSVHVSVQSPAVRMWGGESLTWIAGLLPDNLSWTRPVRAARGVARKSSLTACDPSTRRGGSGCSGAAGQRGSGVGSLIMVLKRRDDCSERSAIADQFHGIMCSRFLTL